MNKLNEFAYLIMADGRGRVALFIILAVTAFVFGHQNT